MHCTFKINIGIIDNLHVWLILPESLFAKLKLITKFVVLFQNFSIYVFQMNHHLSVDLFQESLIFHVHPNRPSCGFSYV